MQADEGHSAWNTRFWEVAGIQVGSFKLPELGNLFVLMTPILFCQRNDCCSTFHFFLSKEMRNFRKVNIKCFKAVK
jgi:hypothetical protein